MVSCGGKGKISWGQEGLGPPQGALRLNVKAETLAALVSSTALGSGTTLVIGYETYNLPVG